MTAVGDTLWTHPHGMPERIGQEKGVITGETSRSWLVGDPKFPREKVSKDKLRETIPRFAYRQWYTEQGMKDCVFIRAHRHHISAAVLGVNDVAMLKEIARIIGMLLEPK